MPRPGWHLRAVMRDRATGNSHGDAQRRIAARKVREQAHREAVDASETRNRTWTVEQARALCADAINAGQG